MRPRQNIHRNYHDVNEATSSVVLYENVKADDGAWLRHQGRVLRFVADATDEEISATAAEVSTDQLVYWAHFGEGPSGSRAAALAARRFEADGIPTRTGRYQGAAWDHVDSRVPVTRADFGFETVDGAQGD